MVSIEEYGGDDGLIIYERSTFGGLIDLENEWTFYYVCLLSLCGAVYLVHRLINSRFGMVISGSRSNDRRMAAIGFPTFRYRLTAYVISGAICGYAGALLGNFTRFISPEMMDWTRSGELIFMDCAEKSGVNSLPSATPRWKGFESPVSTVPGCRPTHRAVGFLRASSIESVFSNWFSAALDAR